MAMEFTETQKAAIETSDRNILVSASAGSGKTRVLVERVIQKLLAGQDIDRFLIVTFTEAAAAEMKDRLERTLIQALHTSDESMKPRLRRQLRLLKVANISTLHAFALRLIEQYHYAINLDPQFRLADDAESTLLMLEVYQDVLEQAYENDSDGHFKRFVRQFATSSQEDRPLQDAVFKLFNFAMARPDTDEWLASLSSSYQINGDFGQSQFFKKQLAPEITKKLDSLIIQNQSLQAEAIVDEADAGTKNRFENLLHDGQLLDQIRQQLNAQDNLAWNQLITMIQAQSFDGWGKIDGKGKNFKKDTDVSIKNSWATIKDRRDVIIGEFNQLKKTYFLLDAEGLAVTLTGARQVIEDLVVLVQSFRHQFLAEKLRRKVLDFNDLEHFALAIVEQEPIATELREQYTEIMVDEYQDTNQLQEAILKAFARPNNVFQVGDIKQSIYKFRQADPTLFREKLQVYPQAEASTVITLQENFRSRPNVTNFINYLFTQLMSEDLGDVDYAGPHKLVAGADYYPAELPKHAELLVYLNNQADQDEDNQEVVVDDEGYTATTGQITLMGLKIKALMAEGMLIYDREQQKQRPLTYGDITILVPARGQNLDVLSVFRGLAIPITISGAENFFQTMEVSIMLSLLQIIDNPQQDIPLAAVLRSPIYNLAENALAFIRAQKIDGDFFTAVKKTVAESTILLATDALSAADIETIITTLRRFLSDLDAFRQLAVQNQIVSLIWEIYRRTNWLDYVGGLPAGEQRQANLHALYERAAAYQRSSFVGLYQFINYVQQIQAQDKDLGVADANVLSDAVQLMTIHHSKGLEFPVVFMLNTSRKMISGQDTAGSIILDAKAGVGIDFTDVEHNLRLPTPEKAYVKEAIRRDAFAEQLRVLYVALTRAEQHIFMVGTYKSTDELWKKWSAAKYGSQTMLPDWVRLQGNSYLDLAGMALLRHPNSQTKLSANDDFDFSEFTPLVPINDFDFDFTIVNSSDLAKLATRVNANDTHQTSSDLDSIKDLELEKLVGEWQQTFKYDYQFANATRASNYQSVSELKRLFEDPDIVDGQPGVDRRLVGDDYAGLRFKTTELPEPSFMQVDTNQVSAAAVGTATHLLMQQIDLTQTGDLMQRLQTLLNQLVVDGIIEPAVGQKINLTQIVEFFQDSELGLKMQANLASLEREVPFSLLLQADRLYQGVDADEKVLVHGIMDGYFLVGDETWLFDYKTDYIAANEDAKIVLKQRYQAQLRIYAQALTAMGKVNVRTFIYSLNQNQLIEL